MDYIIFAGCFMPVGMKLLGFMVGGEIYKFIHSSTFNLFCLFYFCGCTLYALLYYILVQ